MILWRVKLEGAGSSIIWGLGIGFIEMFIYLLVYHSGCGVPESYSTRNIAEWLQFNWCEECKSKLQFMIFGRALICNVSTKTFVTLVPLIGSIRLQ